MWRGRRVWKLFVSFFARDGAFSAGGEGHQFACHLGSSYCACLMSYSYDGNADVDKEMRAEEEGDLDLSRINCKSANGEDVIFADDDHNQVKYEYHD